MSNSKANQQGSSVDVSEEDSEYGKMNPAVFYISSAIILAIIAYTCYANEAAQEQFKMIQDGIIAYAGWYYVLTVAAIVVLTIFVCISR